MDPMVHYYQRLFRWIESFFKKMPIVDASAVHHGLQGHWFIVTPVHWQATHNDAMILACGKGLNLSELQGRELYREFSSFVEGDGMKTHYVNAYTWLIRVDGRPKISSISPYDIIHKSIAPYLKSLDESLFWQRFITEIQMLLSGSANHQSSVNGVWVWEESPSVKNSWLLRLFSFKRVG